MSRRPSQSARTWVNRTPSGLPLCSACQKELGFCPHSRMLAASQRRSASSEEGPSCVPNAIAMDNRNTGEQDLQFFESGVKRRFSTLRGGHATQSSQRGAESMKKRKCASRGTARKQARLAASRTAEAAEQDTKREQPRAINGPHRHDTRYAAAQARSKARASRTVDSDRSDDAACDRDSLLRFAGFERNSAEKECLGCYQAEEIMISFGCEERRRKGLQHQNDPGDCAESYTGRPADICGLDVTTAHVMCLDCFRRFVESRVNDRKLVTSREFEGYTVGCPMGCPDSFVDPACFEEVLGADFMVRYRRFSAIHLASDMRIVWCPGCHCGVVPSAATAAAARAARLYSAPEIAPAVPGPTAWSLLGAGAPAAAGEVVPRHSNCVGCPGCQASLCLSCKALHEPTADCVDIRDESVIDDANGSASPLRVEDEDVGSAAPRRSSIGSRVARADGESACTKRCPNCHVPIFKDGGCNHMTCGMCRHEFCWLHLTEWVVGGPCQLGHWSSDPLLNRAYNAQATATTSVRNACVIS